MLQSKQIIILDSKVPIRAIAILAIVLGFGVFTIGYDQGHVLSLAFGEQAFNDIYIHELTHDMRHSAGFPCH